MIPVTYGYARANKADGDEKHLERVQAGDTIIVPEQDRFSFHFEQWDSHAGGPDQQRDLDRRHQGEQRNRDGIVGANLCYGMMLA